MSESNERRRSRQSFRDLRAWQEAIVLAVEAEALAGALPHTNLRLADQLRAAADSVHLNLSEGTSRPTKRAFAQAVIYARGSLHEVESAITRIRRTLPHLAPQVDRMHPRIRHIEQLIAGLLRYLSR